MGQEYLISKEQKYLDHSIKLTTLEILIKVDQGWAYIADELSKKIKAKISLVTQKKRGSIFIVKIPKNLKN